MGGSLALRLKAKRVCRRVVALVRREAAAAEAQRQGAVDVATTNPTLALADADIVVFSTPVRVLVQQLHNYASLLKPGAIVTDLGSTKRTIMQALDNLPPHVHPVGSHPMCGKETSGLAAADTDLYEGATWVVSPLPRTPQPALDMIEHLARAVGAVPLRLDSQQHDRLVAAISHLPYLLAVGLMLTAQTVATQDDLVWRVAASGFKDTSRLAASNVNMMLDILMTNSDAVLEMVEQVQQQLNTISQAMAAGNEETLRALLEQAKTQRSTLYLPPASP